MIATYLKDDQIDALNNYLENRHAHDVAVEIEQLSEIERNHFCKVVSLDILSDLLPYLNLQDAKNIILRFDINQQVKILNEMASDDLVDILSGYPFKTRNQILPQLDESAHLKELLKYRENDTGSYMSYEVVKVVSGIDVKDATKQLIAQAPDVESITSIFVTDSNNKLLGIVPFKKMIKAKSPMVIDMLLDDQYVIALDTDDIEHTVRNMVNYKIYEMPVVDKDNFFLGIVTYDDAFDVYVDETEEDFERLAALPDTKKESAVKTAYRRLPWLIILIILSIPVALLTETFEKQVTGIIIIALFQPVILDTPGNIATQTLAVTLTQLNDNGRIKTRDFIKELLSAIFAALIMSVIAFLCSYIFMMIKSPSYDGWVLIPSINRLLLPLMIAGILALSLFAVVVIAPILAIIIPVLFHKIKIDPSLASGPFITTIIDIVSNAIYFGIAILLLVKTGVLVHV